MVLNNLEVSLLFIVIDTKGKDFFGLQITSKAMKSKGPNMFS